jgi:hypothetical protein
MYYTHTHTHTHTHTERYYKPREGKAGVKDLSTDFSTDLSLDLVKQNKTLKAPILKSALYLLLATRYSVLCIESAIQSTE